MAGGHQPDLATTQLDLKHIAGLEAKLGGVGLAHQQVAVELHLGHIAQGAASFALALIAGLQVRGP